MSKVADDGASSGRYTITSLEVQRLLVLSNLGEGSRLLHLA